MAETPEFKAYRIGSQPYYRLGVYYEPGTVVRIPADEKPSKHWKEVPLELVVDDELAALDEDQLAERARSIEQQAEELLRRQQEIAAAIATRRGGPAALSGVKPLTDEQLNSIADKAAAARAQVEAGAAAARGEQAPADPPPPPAPEDDTPATRHEAAKQKAAARDRKL